MSKETIKVEISKQALENNDAQLILLEIKDYLEKQECEETK